MRMLGHCEVLHVAEIVVILAGMGSGNAAGSFLFNCPG